MSIAPMDLWRNRMLRFLLGAAPTFLYALLGIVRNKWLAHHLATAGFGTLVQVLAAMNWLGQATGLGLGLPLTRGVAAARAGADAAAERRMVHTAFTVVLVSAAIVVALALLAAPWISAAILGTREYAPLVRVSAVGIAGLALAGTLLAVFAGHGDVRAPLVLAAGGAGTATVLTFALVPRLGLAGATVAASILYPAGFLVALAWSRRRYSTALRGSAPFDGAEARSMVGIGAAGLLLGLLDQGTLLALRAHYVHAHGVAANGLLQAALALAQMIGSLFYAYLTGYAFGIISGAAQAAGGGAPAAVRAYTRRQWPALILLAALLLGIAMVAAAPLLRLLYSSRFDPARPLMTWTLLGEFGRVGMQVWMLGALPLGGIRLLAPIMLSYPVSLAGGYALFTAAGAGPAALPRAYAVAGACSLAAAMLLMGRRGVAPGARDLLALAAGAALLAALAVWSLG
jgi:Na+-driven multidrug efflux pump